MGVTLDVTYLSPSSGRAFNPCLQCLRRLLFGHMSAREATQQGSKTLYAAQAQKQSAGTPANSEMLARKAASLDQQRSRFRRALGGDEEPATEVSFSG